MRDNRIRFWSIQKHRLCDRIQELPFFQRETSERLFASAAVCVTAAADSLIRIGPMHSASDDELFALAEELSSMMTALAIELDIRKAGKLCLLRFDTPDQLRAFLVSSVSRDR